MADEALRRQLIKTLNGGHAFDRFEDIVTQVPEQFRFEAPDDEGRSAWQIVVHMTRSLDDLADFIDNEEGTYKAKNWPDEYWPQPLSEPKMDDWNSAIAAFLAQRKRLELLIDDPQRDLYAPFTWGDGQTLLHEALLAIEHSAYHLGELVELSVFQPGE